MGDIFFSEPPCLLVSLTSVTSDSMAVARSCGYITCITCFHSCGGFVNRFESRFDVSPSCVGADCRLFVACVFWLSPHLRGDDLSFFRFSYNLLSALRVVSGLSWFFLYFQTSPTKYFP